ncbi:peptide ABC transporter substrate-binding protein [Leekyejoonella antrihumi]|uniref:Peptide ABC transporter substrate-binding protein n=1 Tax=Leekyejoonella antrihumi TaxID=1660198 RepID=A0A563E5Y3_9MICO|nr:peptide ABC transporter substrate-binding protein [Leekyejoonella antrihumi]TWP37653.1 peptide ABC transporter substrate-binding protein [Leekyejoonella antrihumi]
MSKSHIKGPAMAAALAFVSAVTLAACSSSSTGAASSPSGSTSSGAGAATPTGQKVKGGSVSVALPAAVTANWIFPFSSGAFFSVYNISDLQQPMYRPLYWFGGENNQPTLDLGLSAATAPVYSNGGKTVTVSLKNWKWSNGETVDASDVVFWMNMMKAEKTNWAGYTPGLFPDNVKSVTKVNAQTVRFDLTQGYSDNWFTYNELSQITPMPMAWDVTKAGAKPGSGGCAVAVVKCKAVYNFLTTQSKNLTGYASSPVWGVVDGPWRLGAFSSGGQYTLVPNPKWSGNPKPQLASVKFLPFTTDAAEFNELKSSSNIDLGYIPSADLSPKPASQLLPKTNPAGSNYNLKPNYTWSVNYFPENFNSAKLGTVFKQLYFRKAFQMVMDQEVDANKAYRGYGYANFGPVPVNPPSKWLSPQAKTNKAVYPFNPAKAKKLLTSHGWTEQGGVMTCTKPGAGSNQCGVGVKAGTKLNIKLNYASGAAALTLTMEQLKSDASKAGIDVTESEEPFNSVIASASPTSKSWEMADWGGGWIYAPDYLPTGESLFQTGAGSNYGSYSSKAMDAAIKATTTANGTGPLFTYQDLVAQQLPVVFQANSYGISAISKHVGGVILNPLGALNAEYWYQTK